MEKMATFFDILARKTAIRMTNQLIILFHHLDFDLYLLRDKLRPISDFRKLSSQKCRYMFRNSGFEETALNTTWADVEKGRTTMYLRDTAQASKRRSLFNRSDDLLFSSIAKSTRSDVT